MVLFWDLDILKKIGKLEIYNGIIKKFNIWGNLDIFMWFKDCKSFNVIIKILWYLFFYMFLFKLYVI